MQVSFVSLLTVVFVVLKLVGSITWSWLWVLSPLWITVIIVALFTMLIVFFAKDSDV